MKKQSPDKNDDRKSNTPGPSHLTIDQAAQDPLAAMLKSGRRRNRIRRTMMIIAALIIAGGAAFLVIRWRKDAADAKLPQYVSEQVTKGDLTASISATGTVQALNTVDVGAEISGRIMVLKVDFNDTVIKDQVLAVIDPEQLKAQAAQVKAQMLAAEAQVAVAEATVVETKQMVARARDLSAKGLSASKDLEGAEAGAARAEASLKSAKAQLALSKAAYDAADSKLKKTEIISPINGTVLSRAVEVGQTINAGMQTPVLFTIAEDLKRMKLSSRVDEADIGNVIKGQSAAFTVDAYPGRKFHSTVTEVRNVPKTDQNVVSYEVLLSVDNEKMLLKPGMTASVEIVTEKHTNVMLVPNKAFRFAPPKEGFMFRGPPMPIIGGRNKNADKMKDADPIRNLGKIGENEGVLWMVDKKGPPGSLKPFKIEKIASDGIRTAIRSSDIRVGDEVIIEQSDIEQSKP
jgi:HlyD family secretion protein